jgi:hypothetical protein
MDIANILTIKYPGTIWTLNGDLYDGLEWLDKSPKPTEEELESSWTEVQESSLPKPMLRHPHLLS